MHRGGVGTYFSRCLLSLHKVLHWQTHYECGPLSRFTFGGYAPAMAFDHLTAYGKTHSSSLVFTTPAMKALEWKEDFLGVLRIEADPVVLYGNPAKIIFS